MLDEEGHVIEEGRYEAQQDPFYYSCLFVVFLKVFNSLSVCERPFIWSSCVYISNVTYPTYSKL